MFAHQEIKSNKQIKNIAFCDLGRDKKVELKTKMRNEKNIFIN